MSSDQNSSFTSKVTGTWDSIPLSSVGRFWLLLVPDVVSIIVAIVVLVYIIFNKKARESVKNHVIFILLSVGLGIQLIDTPFYMSFVAHGKVVPAYPSICLIWNFSNFGLYPGQLIILVWMAFERHIIVFHDRWLATLKKRIIIHYLPLAVLVLYILIFYIYVIYFYPCENSYAYTSLLCGADPCYRKYKIYIWEICVNYIVATFLEVIFTLTFLLRVIGKKICAHQSIQWKKQRKMAIQLLSVSTFNLFLNVPFCVYITSILASSPLYFSVDARSYLNFLMYYDSMFLPFVCLVTVVNIKGIYQKTKSRGRRIHPQ